MKTKGTTGSDNPHARLAPSDSARWTQCTAAIAFCEANSHRLPKDTGSYYASEGTEAHQYAEAVLTSKLTIDQVPDGDTLRDDKFPDTDFRTPVGAYVDHCRRIAPEGPQFVEVRTPLFYDENSKGTCDFGAVVPTDNGYRVHIEDLKFGEGVLVDVNANSQLAIYALSLVRFLEDVYDFTPDTPIHIGICQPRHREADNEPWVLTLAELEEFCKDIDYKAIQVRTAADRVRDKLPCGERDVTCDEILEAAPGAKFAPGEKPCRWCPARGMCAARLAACDDGMPEGSTVDFLSLLPDLDKDERKQEVGDRLKTYEALIGGGNLDDAALVGLYKQSKAITTFLSDVAEYLETLALEGRPVEGTKLCLGRSGNRAWADESAADTFLSGQKISADDRYKKKLISPTEAEKLLKDKLKKVKRTATRFETLVTRSAPKKVLALADDKRPAVGADVDMLGDLTAADDFEV